MQQRIQRSSMVQRCRRSGVPWIEVNCGHLLLAQRNPIRSLKLLLKANWPGPLVLRITNTDANEMAALSDTIDEAIPSV